MLTRVPQSRAQGSFFVVAALKVRQPGQLTRSIRALRDLNGYDGEFKFNQITRGKLPIYSQLIDLIEAADSHIAACVVDRSGGQDDPFMPTEPSWLTHARITAKLLVGIMNRRELSAALIDEISTPVGCAFDDTVRAMVNTRLKSTGLVMAACIDSASNDGVQMADLVAGAVALHQRAKIDGAVNPNSHKAKVAARLAAAFGVANLSDVRTDRVNVQTHGKRSSQRGLRTVGKIGTTGS